MIPSSLHMEVYFCSCDQKYHKFSYLFFIFQQLWSHISQIDINADIAFCNETLQFFLDTETVFVTIIHVVKFNTIIVIDVVYIYCYHYCFSILITLLFLFLFVSSDSAWQGAPQQPSQQSLSVVTTVWGVTQTNDSNSMMNNSFRGGTCE